MTLTTFPHLRAYWFNPKTTTITMKLRNHRRFTTHFHQEDILTRLAAARAALDGSNDLRKVQSARAQGISKLTGLV